MSYIDPAEQDINKATAGFEKDLKRIAQRYARSDGVNGVSPIHVSRALTNLRRPTRLDKMRQIAGIVGPLALGAVGPTFFTIVFGQNTNTPPSTLSGLTVGLVVGLALTFFSLRDRD